jgi:hypothetical protein
MTINRESMPGTHRTNFEKCPWADMPETLELPLE